MIDSAGVTGRFPRLVPMLGRDPDESHRPSTPLELFFDLCFVVAISQAASSLHHAVAEDHLRVALTGYSTVFFAIWWAWVNFSWFASSYDNDDVLYRVAVFVQIGGVLILAAGVPRAFDSADFGVVVLGYVVMRIGLVSLWLRAASNDPERRRTDLRYAVGLLAVQVGWIMFLFVPVSWRLPLFCVLVVFELSVPVWSERAGRLNWHPQHIAERYGLFTIIVLGESVLAATVAIQSALDAGRAFDDLVGVALSALLIVCSMWWIYFDQRSDELVTGARRAFVTTSTADGFIWGYGHYFIYASAAAVGAGVAVVVDQVTDHAAVSAVTAALTVAIPSAVYIVTVWLLHQRDQMWTAGAIVYPVTAVLIVAAALAGLPVLSTGALLALLVGTTLVLRSPNSTDPTESTAGGPPAR